MLIVQTQIFINQVATKDFPDRQYEFALDFACEFSATSSWKDFTNNCTITLPKNFPYTDTTGAVLVNPAGTNVNIGGFDTAAPLFLKGDEVTVVAGYKYLLNNQWITDTAVIFSGYISKVSSKKPFTLECEDNMYKLKQIHTPNKAFPSNRYKLETMLAELLAGTPYTVNQTGKTDIQDFRTQNETVMDVIARLHKDHHYEAFFVGNELYCGPVVVYTNPGNTYTFVFQNNIIDDDLEYKRKDDIVLSAVAYSENTSDQGGTTKDGATKTKRQRLQVLVTAENGAFTVTQAPPGKDSDFPPNETGERRSLFYTNVTDPNKLAANAIAELSKYYYTGFRGKFKTFGIPYVQQGDNVAIYDTVLPERSGTYKVKAVEYTFSVEDGLRQEIELDYRIGDNADKQPKLY